MGQDYIAQAFRLAHDADPNAELWLSEVGTEYLPGKADTLIGLVRDLVADGVPIDGVGFQTHLIADVPLSPGTFRSTMQSMTELGLDVAVTELDVPIGPTRGEDEQAAPFTAFSQEQLLF